MSYFSDIAIDPKEGNCEKLLENYADKSATFMYCAILNARPITFCESCVDGYIDVLSADQEIYVVNIGDFWVC